MIQPQALTEVGLFKNRILTAATLAGLMAAPLTGQAAEPSVATQTVDTMNKLWGRHPGMRANHAKGVVVEGSFSPTEAGKSVSTAALFSSGTIPVMVRFSDSTGLPDLPDGSADASPHGMSIRFQLADKYVDVVTNSLAFFPVKNGEEFLALLQAAGASEGKPHPTPIEQFFATHPQAPKAFGSTTTPSSFAREQYNGVDAFIFIDAAGKHQAFRWVILPEAGVEHLSTEASKAEPKDFLVNELPERLKSGPVKFRLMAVLAEPGDPTDDATQPWPADRKSINVGEITLIKAAADNVAAQKALRMLPNDLCPGIEVSNDPLIDARIRSYVISFGRCVGG